MSNKFYKSKMIVKVKRIIEVETLCEITVSARDVDDAKSKFNNLLLTSGIIESCDVEKIELIDKDSLAKTLLEQAVESVSSGEVAAIKYDIRDLKIKEL